MPSWWYQVEVRNYYVISYFQFIPCCGSNARCFSFGALGLGFAALLWAACCFRDTWLKRLGPSGCHVFDRGECETCSVFSVVGFLMLTVAIWSSSPAPMSLASCCVVQNRGSEKDAETAAEFLSKFQSKHAEVSKLVAEDYAFLSVYFLAHFRDFTLVTVSITQRPGRGYALDLVLLFGKDALWGWCHRTPLAGPSNTGFQIGWTSIFQHLWHPSSSFGSVFQESQWDRSRDSSRCWILWDEAYQI